ncbi:MAG: hypothetical protein VKJ02_13925 [Snowella sp.]|nr:hypothetical protein [Snowella sp.]
MLTSLWCWRGSLPTSSLLIFLSQLVLTSNLTVSASPLSLVPELAPMPIAPIHQLALTNTPATLKVVPSLSDSGMNNEDPLNSPHPVPWNWIMKTQEEYSQRGSSGLRYYRSPALVSPNGQYAAYSRIEMRAEPELYASKVLSVLFLENLETGELQVIRAGSPIANYLEETGVDSQEMTGVISILMPISWSSGGDRLLARQFEGVFSTSDVMDYAVIWNQQTRQSQTLGLDLNEDQETTATLLGWSPTKPDQVLFRSAILGEDTEKIVSVGSNGKASWAGDEDAVTYGQLMNRSWTGIQALK